MEITPELLATGGILGALAIAVFRILQADPPLARAVVTAERREAEAEAETAVLRRENERLRGDLAKTHTKLAVAKAWIAFHAPNIEAVPPELREDLEGEV